MVLFAISSVNIVEVRGAPAVAAGGVLRAGARRRPGDHADRRHVDGPSAPPRRAAAAVAVAARTRSRRPMRRRTPPRRPNAGRAGAAGLPGAQAARSTARRRRPGLQGKVVRPPCAGAACVIRLLTDKRVLRLRAAPRSSRPPRPIARQDRPDHRATSASTRSSSRATPTTQPIPRSQYPSNWELSGARAGAVVQRLRRATACSAERLSLGRLRRRSSPIASNATPAGRAQNRRVEIVLDPPRHGADPRTEATHHEQEDDHPRRRRAASPLGGAYKFVLAKPAKAEPKPKVDGHRLRARQGVPRQPRRRPLREAHRRRSCSRTTTRRAAAAGGEARRRRPRATARCPRRPSCATSSPTTLTDAKDDELIEPRGPREAQEGDPQGAQEAHRRQGRGRPVPRRHRPVRHP